MATASIVFPRPPPTYNTLSQAQRAQLLRSSAKLGQILGSTPHILDDSDALPITPPKRSSSLKSTRSPSVASTASTASTSSTQSESGHSERSWRARFPLCKPPLLRIGKVASTPPAPHPTPKSPDAPSQAYQTVHVSPAGSPGGSPQEPSFSIPSDAAIRRQKMRRIAKKLGEGVPVHLIFPPTLESDEEEVFVESPTSMCVPCHAARSSTSLSSASDRGSEESAGEARSWEEKDLLWGRQTTRRSKFARASTVLSGQYIVHYHDEDGVHGRSEETFGMLSCGKFAPIPEEDVGIGYAI